VLRRAIREATVVQQTPTGAPLRNPALQVHYADPTGQPTTVVFLVKKPSEWALRLAPSVGGS
jgi:hypothetical protein